MEYQKEDVFLLPLNLNICSVYSETIFIGFPIIVIGYDNSKNVMNTYFDLLTEKTRLCG